MLKISQIIPDDGFADGGEPYTDDEMDLMNSQESQFPPMPEQSPEDRRNTEQVVGIAIAKLEEVIKLLRLGDTEKYSIAYNRAGDAMIYLEELNEKFPSKWKRISNQSSEIPGEL